MSEELIKRSDAITVIEKNEYRLKGNGLTYQILLKQIDEIPSVDIPQSDDWEKYSDKLWKIAYERGKEEEKRWWSGFCANCTDGDKPQGKWIGERVGHGPGYTCSICGYGVQPWNNTNFCPHCGAKMKGIDNE